MEVESMNQSPKKTYAIIQSVRFNRNGVNSLTPLLFKK